MKIIYYLLLKPLVALPWPILYLLSDLLYLIGYKVFRYRIHIVDENLKNSFPEKSRQERINIRRKFYRHFFDLTLESLKMITQNASQMRERFNIINPELVNAFTEKNRDVIVVGGHYNNWEFLAYSMDMWLKGQAVGVYHQFKNNFFEKKMRQARAQLGMHLVSRSEAREGALEMLDMRIVLLFFADQSPTIAKKVYWTNFLNQETAVAFGTEKYALQKDAAVVYFHNKKVGRGKYEVTFQLLSEFPNKEAHGAITEKHVRALEEDILEAPEYWLWTHRRWKRKRV